MNIASTPVETPTGDLLRIPPHNAASEAALVGTLLVRPSALDAVVTILAPDDFYGYRPRRLYEVLASMHLDGRRPDVVTVLEEIERLHLGKDLDREYLSEVTRAAEIDVDPLTHARLVREKAIARELLFTSEGVRESVLAGESTDATLKRALDRFTLLSHQAAPVGLSDVIKPRSTAEILAAPRTNPDDHFWAYVVAPKLLTILVGFPKAGKTYLVAAFLAEVMRGGQWANKPVRPARVLYLTEESDATLQPRIDRFGIGEIHWVTPADVEPGATWPRIVAWLADKAATQSYDLIVVDTIRHWCDITDENDSTAIRLAMKPLVSVKARGPAVIAVHHSVKNGDARGVRAVAGSLALAGAADVIVTLRRKDENDPDDAHRVLGVSGRFPEGEGETIVRLSQAGPGCADTYEFCGNPRDLARQQDVDAIETYLRDQGPAWWPRDVLRKSSGLSKGRFDAAMPTLLRNARIAARSIKGRGAPQQYAIPGTPADAPIVPETTENA